jgi:putative tricarboxylic transport membrane protein
MVTTAAGNVAGHLAEGRMRVIGVSSAKRFPGAFANVPTWKEQGANLVYGGWRAIMAPKGITPAQIAYWEGVLRKVASTPEWKADLEKNYWSDDFVGHEQFSKDIAKDYNDIKAVLVDIGLAKQ